MSGGLWVFGTLFSTFICFKYFISKRAKYRTINNTLPYTNLTKRRYLHICTRLDDSRRGGLKAPLLGAGAGGARRDWGGEGGEAPLLGRGDGLLFCCAQFG